MKSNLKYILKKELREVFRDKKSLMMMLIVPIMIPLVILGMSSLFNTQMNLDISTYNRVGFSYSFDLVEEEIARNLNIDYQFDSPESLQNKLENGSILLYVLKDGNHYTLKYNANNGNSSLALGLVKTFYEQYKRVLQEQQLDLLNVDKSVLDMVIVIEEQVLENTFASTYIVGYAFLFILMAITISATYPATDTTAGEKERGTLETLLTFPIRSRDIILGKLFSVTLSSIVTGIVSLILAIISFQFANCSFEIYESTPIVITIPQIFVSVLVIIIFSIFMSGLCIAIASQSKTFKEAQSALTPLTFVSFFPGMIAFMIEVENNFWYSMIPFLNFSMILNDLSVGIISISCLVTMVISSLLCISVVIWYIIFQYKTEKVLFSI